MTWPYAANPAADGDLLVMWRCVTVYGEGATSVHVSRGTCFPFRLTRPRCEDRAMDPALRYDRSVWISI